MLKKSDSKLLILGFLIVAFLPGPVFAKDDKAPDPLLTKVYRMLCHEEYDDAADELQKELKENPKNVAASLVYLFDPKYQAIVAAKIGLKELSEPDRVVVTSYMIATRSLDFPKMKELLNFNSSDAVTESYRKVYSANLDLLESKYDEGVKKLAEATEVLPYYDPVVLTQLLSYALKSSIHKDIADKYGHVNKVFDDDDPARLSLKAYEKVADGDERKMQEISDNVQESYEMCPYDPGFAMDRANFLFQQDQKVEARDILLESIKRHNLYPVYMDLLLAEIYDVNGDVPNRDKHFARVKAAMPYFDEETKDHIAELEPAHSEADLKLYAMVFGIFIVLAAALAYWNLKKKNA